VAAARRRNAQRRRRLGAPCAQHDFHRRTVSLRVATELDLLLDPRAVVFARGRSREAPGPCCAIGRCCAVCCVPAAWRSLRARLNRALLFAGLAVSDSGQLGSVERASTISEAEQRARELRADLVARGVHPDVLKFCREELLPFTACLQYSTARIAPTQRSPRVFTHIWTRTRLCGMAA
jgi:hypothetical protein